MTDTIHIIDLTKEQITEANLKGELEELYKRVVNCDGPYFSEDNETASPSYLKFKILHLEVENWSNFSKNQEYLDGYIPMQDALDEVVRKRLGTLRATIRTATETAFEGIEDEMEKVRQKQTDLLGEFM